MGRHFAISNRLRTYAERRALYDAMLINPDSEVTEARRATTAKHQVLIVDDHHVFRHGLSQVIAHEEDLEVCAEAGNAREAIEVVGRLKPDLALLDISLRGTNGIDLLKHLKAAQPGLPVLILSMHDESLYALPALRAGASGYVMKSEALQQVVAAIRRVLCGQLYVSPDLSEQLILKAMQAFSQNSSSPGDLLSERELEVLHLIGRGCEMRDIARELNAGVESIEGDRARIKEKLGCESGDDVVRFVLEWIGRQGE